MYGVTSKMTALASARPVPRTTSKKASLSPELREVLHMLEALEQNAGNEKPAK